MIQFFSNPIWQILTTTGVPLVGGALYFYAAGTSTPQNTYPTIADAIALTNANSNPIILDEYGMPTTVNIVLIPQKSYKLIIKDAAGGNTIRTLDNIKFTNDTYDANGNLEISFTTTSSAVNYIDVANAATGNVPVISAAGTDTNIGLRLLPKGSGNISLGVGSSNIIDFLKTDSGRARFSLANISSSTTRTYTFSDFSGTFVLSSSTGILDTNGNVMLGETIGSASAVNYVNITNSATGTGPTIAAAGTDTNITLDIKGKGSSTVRIHTGSSSNEFMDIIDDVTSGRARLVTSSITSSTIRTYTFPDMNGTFLLNSGTNTMAASSSIVLAKTNGTESGNAVTASGMSGVITTSALTTAAAGSYAITWTNTFISATSTIHLTDHGGTNTRQSFRMKVVPGSGSATLTIYNNEPSNALNGTILIGYTVL